MKQARRGRLRDRAADQLLEMVVSGGLEPGERLPSERELCERLGVSRTVVREALNLLEARGLISIEHGRGAVVSGGNIDAERATEEDTDAMRVQLERMAALIDVPEGYVNADVEFHALLARAARNGVLLTMLEPIVDLLRASREFSSSWPGSARRAVG